MMTTVQEHIAKQTAAFLSLSKSRQATLKRKAKQYIDAHPGCADHSTFWRGLSARQITYISASR